MARSEFAQTSQPLRSLHGQLVCVTQFHAARVPSAFKATVCNPPAAMATTPLTNGCGATAHLE